MLYNLKHPHLYTVLFLHYIIISTLIKPRQEYVYRVSQLKIKYIININVCVIRTAGVEHLQLTRYGVVNYTCIPPPYYDNS